MLGNWESKNCSIRVAETIRSRGPKTWDMVPHHITDSKTLAEFKSKIRTWKPIECTCRLCKTFIPELGFIN